MTAKLPPSALDEIAIILDAILVLPQSPQLAAATIRQSAQSLERALDAEDTVPAITRVNGYLRDGYADLREWVETDLIPRLTDDDDVPLDLTGGAAS